MQKETVLTKTKLQKLPSTSVEAIELNAYVKDHAVKKEHAFSKNKYDDDSRMGITSFQFHN